MKKASEAKPTSIDAYLETLEPNQRRTATLLRQLVHEAVRGCSRNHLCFASRVLYPRRGHHFVSQIAPDYDGVFRRSREYFRSRKRGVSLAVVGLYDDAETYFASLF
ncbi:MAG: hypothetical protein MZU97_19870 [Bacillus subtilis]|nr:hypothetical protein [Bacillus subtilis]